MSVIVDMKHKRIGTADKPLWQYDYGQTVTIQNVDIPNGTIAVHFEAKHKEGAIVTSGSASGGTVIAQIPDQLLSLPVVWNYDIMCYVFVTTQSSGTTKYTALLNVAHRGAQTGGAPTPAEQSAWEQAMADLAVYQDEINATVEGIEDEVHRTFEAIVSENINLYSFADLQIGKNWVGGSAEDRAIVYIPVKPSSTVYIYPPTHPKMTRMNVMQTATAVDGSTNISNVEITCGQYSTIQIDANTLYLRLQFLGTSSFAVSDFEDYDLKVFQDSKFTAYDKIARRDISSIERDILSISEMKPNLFDVSNVVIGKNWTDTDASNRAICYIKVSPNTEYSYEITENTVFTGTTIVEKTTNAGGTNINSFALGRISDFKTFTTKPTTQYLCVQFESSSTVSSADFDHYSLYICEGNSKYQAKDPVARQYIPGADTVHSNTLAVQNSANIDYIAMMTDIEIPTDGGAEDEQ